MDLCFSRYASPFSFMDEMIRADRFEEFVDNFVITLNKEIKGENEEKEMKFHWEFYLHRIFEQTFQDYLAEIESVNEHKNMSERTIETTVQHSMNLLNNFNPETRG